MYSFFDVVDITTIVITLLFSTRLSFFGNNVVKSSMNVRIYKYFWHEMLPLDIL